MKTSSLDIRVLAAILAVLMTLPLSAFNVKDFGARGDGIADDTAAIQAAINAAHKQMTFLPAGRTEIPKWGGHGGLGGGGEVFFPAGTYRISSPIFFKGHRIEFRAEPGTTLKASGDHDIIYVHGVVHTTLENFNFKGGRIQFNIFTNNHDMTMIRVENCTFEGASLECVRSFNKGKGTSGNYNGQPPYNIGQDEKGNPTCTVNPDYEATTRRMPNSSLITFINSRFEGACTIFNGGSDTFIMDSCQVIRHASPMRVLDASGTYHLRRSSFKYINDGDKHPESWVSSDSIIMDIMECGFDNSGVKFPLVRSTSRPRYVNSILAVNGNTLNLAGAPIVQYAAGTLTGVLEVLDNRNLHAAKAPVVSYERVPSVDEMQNVIRYKHHRSMPIKNMFKIAVEGNKGFDETLPASQREFRVKAIPAAELKAAYVLQKDAAYWPQEKDFSGREIRVQLEAGKNFTALLQKACDDARPGDRIIIPVTRQTIEATITVPAGVMVLSEGLATLEAGKNVDSMFRIAGKGNSIVRNLVFFGGKQAVEVAVSGARHVFKTCQFFNQSNTAVLAMEKPEAVQIIDTLYYSDGGIETNAAHSEVLRNWACNTPNMNERGFFINHGGDMLSEYNLFVPILPRMDLENGKGIPGYENLNCGNNLRWYDCDNGRTSVLGNRFGGEFLGMTPAYTFGSNASFLMRGGFAWFGNIYIRRTAVYCHDEPKRILFQGVVLGPEGRFKGSANLPYDVTLRNPKDGTDMIGTVLPQIKASALTMHR